MCCCLLREHGLDDEGLKVKLFIVFFYICDVLMPTRIRGLDERKEQESENNVQPRMAKRRKRVTE